MVYVLYVGVYFPVRNVRGTYVYSKKKQLKRTTMWGVYGVRGLVKTHHLVAYYKCYNSYLYCIIYVSFPERYHACI